MEKKEEKTRNYDYISSFECALTLECFAMQIHNAEKWEKFLLIKHKQNERKNEKNGCSVAFCSKELHIELTKKPTHTRGKREKEREAGWVNERQHHECDPLQCHLLGEFLLWILLWEQRLQWTEKKNYDEENEANCECPLLISSQFLSWSLTQKRFAHKKQK